jgi:hypothetical protein
LQDPADYLTVTPIEIGWTGGCVECEDSKVCKQISYRYIKQKQCILGPGPASKCACTYITYVVCRGSTGCPTQQPLPLSEAVY